MSENPTNQTPRNQWDKLAPTRFEQIRLGLDLNYCEVLKPKTLELFENVPKKERVLDLGCGVGDLASDLKGLGAGAVTAVDSSAQSIEIARQNFSSDGVEFHHCESTEFYHREYHTVIASMFLMDTPNLNQEMRCIGSCLSKGGTLIASIPHPCFWPIRRKYFSAPGYNYFEESTHTGPFSLSNEVMMEYNTTHFVRPLSRYLNEISENGMCLMKTIELGDHKSDDEMPRFIFFVARKEF